MKKLGILASVLIAQFFVVSNAYAYCYWQWEGIKSRFVCTEDEGSESCLSIYTSNRAVIYNDSDYEVGFSIRCGDGAADHYQLESGYYQELKCSASNSCQSAAMDIEFDASSRSGYQSKQYSIGSTERTARYKFLSKGSKIDLYKK